MKIYTKTGDGGETGLFGGQRVAKDDLRVAAYGEVDELNATLGFAITQLSAPELADEIRAIQGDLFTLGADLATPAGDGRGREVRVDVDAVAKLEAAIDRHDAENEPLTSFILPGGSPGAAALHVCRTVCRRAERATVRLAAAEDVGPHALAYLNRLSDLLFVLARRVNALEGAAESRWQGGA